jgi:hypothetical protein
MDCRIKSGNDAASFRHCEERSDEAIQLFTRGSGLLRFARNDGDRSRASRTLGALSEASSPTLSPV